MKNNNEFKQKIDEFIMANCDVKLEKFSQGLITTDYKIYGIKTPVLRNFAKNLAKENCPLDAIVPASHEQILLKGFVLGNMKLSDVETIDEFNKFIDKIDNWATCDMIVSSLKKLNTINGYIFFTKLLKEAEPFKIRIGIIGLMDHFLNSDKVDEIISNLLKIKNDNYYVKMAIAWFLCTLACKNFELGKSSIAKFGDKFIRNKSISKCQDSYRLTNKQKQELKDLRIK